jgi:hypothetical protein
VTSAIASSLASPSSPFSLSSTKLLSEDAVNNKFKVVRKLSWILILNVPELWQMASTLLFSSSTTAASSSSSSSSPFSSASSSSNPSTLLPGKKHALSQSQQQGETFFCESSSHLICIPLFVSLPSFFFLDLTPPSFAAKEALQQQQNSPEIERLMKDITALYSEKIRMVLFDQTREDRDRSVPFSVSSPFHHFHFLIIYLPSSSFFYLPLPPPPPLPFPLLPCFLSCIQVLAANFSSQVRVLKNCFHEVFRCFNRLSSLSIPEHFYSPLKKLVGEIKEFYVSGVCRETTQGMYCLVFLFSLLFSLSRPPPPFSL